MPFLAQPFKTKIKYKFAYSHLLKDLQLFSYCLNTSSSCSTLLVILIKFYLLIFRILRGFFLSRKVSNILFIVSLNFISKRKQRTPMHINLAFSTLVCKRIIILAMYPYSFRSQNIHTALLSVLLSRIAKLLLTGLFNCNLLFCCKLQRFRKDKHKYGFVSDEIN